MVKVTLGLGSNVDREDNIRSGIAVLEAVLYDMQISPVYESRAVGFEGADFLNLVVSGSTDLKLNELAALIKDTEFAHGRDIAAPKFSSRQLDIDILTYHELVGDFNGVVLPREEILEQAFVLKPLADIAPTLHHPFLQISYGDLWQSYQGDRSGVWLSEFQLGWQHDEARNAV